MASGSFPRRGQVLTGTVAAVASRYTLPGSLQRTEAPTLGDARALVEIHAVGPLEVMVAGRPANLGTPKQRTLIARTRTSRWTRIAGPQPSSISAAGRPDPDPPGRAAPEGTLKVRRIELTPRILRSERARRANQLERNDEMTRRKS